VKEQTALDGVYRALRQIAVAIVCLVVASDALAARVAGPAPLQVEASPSQRATVDDLAAAYRPSRETTYSVVFSIDERRLAEVLNDKRISRLIGPHRQIAHIDCERQDRVDGEYFVDLAEGGLVPSDAKIVPGYRRRFRLTVADSDVGRLFANPATTMLQPVCLARLFSCPVGVAPKKDEYSVYLTTQWRHDPSSGRRARVPSLAKISTAAALRRLRAHPDVYAVNERCAEDTRKFVDECGMRLQGHYSLELRGDETARRRTLEELARRYGIVAPNQVSVPTMFVEVEIPAPSVAAVSKHSGVVQVRQACRGELF
jgi:hypothetical protein